MDQDKAFHGHTILFKHEEFLNFIVKSVEIACF
jgi:hypothetical protein